MSSSVLLYSVPLAVVPPRVFQCPYGSALRDISVTRFGLTNRVRLASDVPCHGRVRADRTAALSRSGYRHTTQKVAENIHITDRTPSTVAARQSENHLLKLIG